VSIAIRSPARAIAPRPGTVRRAAVAVMASVGHPGVEADMAGIRCPILAILGEDDEYSTQAQIAAVERAATRAASIDFLHLADCRHAPHRDQGPVVVEAIVGFVDGLTD
jgi:pimeloyl-ACP methyl ester carboxylesterase